MRKTIITFVLLLFSTISYSFSQDFNPKYYSDYSLGFDGASVAVFVGKIDEEETNTKVEDMKNKILSISTPINKLTKKNKWLLEKAMNEWEYEKDEYYVVMCADSLYAKDCIILFVKIIGKNSIDWEGYYVQFNK